MKNIIIVVLAITFMSCTQDDEALSRVATISVDEIHATQEYDNYRKVLLESIHSGTRIANYSDLSPLLLKQFESGFTYETIDENQFPEFPGAKEHILAVRREWKAFQVLDDKFNFSSLNKIDRTTIKSNYDKLHEASIDGLQPFIDAHVAELPTKE